MDRGAMLAAIDEMAKLPHGWDSRDAPPPDPKAAARAKQIIQSLELLDINVLRVAPSVDGGLCIHFRNPTKLMTIFCSNEPLSAGVFAKQPPSGARGGEG